MDLVLIGFDGWTSWERRPQLLARALARLGVRTLYVEPGPSLRNLLVTGIKKPRQLLKGQLRQIDENLFVYHCGLRWSIDRGLAGNGVSMAIEEYYIRRVMKYLGMIDPILIYQAPFNRVFINSSGFSLKLYDCIDEWSAFPNTNARLVTQVEKQVLAAADVICCTAKNLIESKRSATTPVFYLPNAVNESFFADFPGAEEDKSDEISLGYVGGFGGDHFNYEIIRGLLKLDRIARRAFRIILVGPILDEYNAEQMSAFSGDPRVTIAGRVDFARMPSIMRRFGYSILPWRVTSLVKTVDPIKVYEYLAVGSPIISAHWKELEKYGSLINFADSSEQYIETIEREERKPPEQKATERNERMALARRHTWGARAQELRSIIEQGLQEKRIQTRKLNPGVFPSDGTRDA